MTLKINVNRRMYTYIVHQGDTVIVSTSYYSPCPMLLVQYRVHDQRVNACIPDKMVAYHSDFNTADLSNSPHSFTESMLYTYASVKKIIIVSRNGLLPTIIQINARVLLI